MKTEEQEAANADFAAGYDDKPTETPVSTQATQQEEVKQDDTKPEDKAQAEAPKAGEVPEPSLKDVLARLEKFEKSHDTVSGKLGRLMQSYEQIQQSLATAQAAAKQVGDAPSKQEIARAAEDPAEWAALKAEYGEWATATEKLLEARIPKFDSEAFAKGFEAKVAEQVKGQTAAMRSEIIDAALNTVLPKWRQEVASEAFTAWIGSQPDDIKGLAESSDVGDAARMLKLFDESRKAKPVPEPEQKKPEATAREKRMAAAVTPRGTGGHAPGKSEIDDFLAGYNG